MSLWTKPLSDITFADIDAFCEEQHREGVQLDYKREVTRDLAKIVAAMANTNGGMILLGVPEKEKTGLPDWPPAQGMATPSGSIQDQVTQLCRTNVSPSLLPSVGPLIANEHLPNCSLAVIRVDQSPVAPHAMRNSNEIPIRTDAVGDLIKLMDLDRIQHLLSHRNRHEQRSEELLQAHEERDARNDRFNSLRRYTFYVVPEIASQQLTTATKCVRSPVETLRGIPGGAVTIDVKHQGKYIDYWGCSVWGDVVHIWHPGEGAKDAVIIEQVARFLLECCERAKRFYLHCDTANPGRLKIGVRLHGVFKRNLSDSHAFFCTEIGCYDEFVHAWSVLDYETFAETEFTVSRPLSGPILDVMQQVMHAFGGPPLAEGYKIIG